MDVLAIVVAGWRTAPAVFVCDHDQVHCGTQLWPRARTPGGSWNKRFRTWKRRMPRTDANLQPLLASRLGLERLDIRDTEPVPQHSFSNSKKKRSQPGTRYHVAVIPAAEVPEGDPEAEAGPPGGKAGSPSRFCRKKYFTTSNNCRRWGPTNLGWCQELAWCEAAHRSWFGRSWKIRKCGLVSTVDSCRLQTSHWDWWISNRV